ncbi:uncharacterized protein VTP21DRAFT_9557 [Calcarisporiella thermophila]|uniref:uncharacterized protein n=1 Tax=Calcarisporiella thermophila TaxID=911321 RepID=UPI0037423FEF
MGRIGTETKLGAANHRAPQGNARPSYFNQNPGVSGIFETRMVLRIGGEHRAIKTKRDSLSLVGLVASIGHPERGRWLASKQAHPSYTPSGHMFVNNTKLIYMELVALINLVAARLD